jgi:toxin ParE1/3/4
LRRIVWSETSRRDFREIVSFIAERNPVAAEQVAQEVLVTVESLARLPTGRSGRVPGTYEELVTKRPYIIAYAFAEHDSLDTLPALVVLRLIHGARHWPRGRWPTQGGQ